MIIFDFDAVLGIFVSFQCGEFRKWACMWFRAVRQQELTPFT